MSWTLKTFEQLSALELYSILEARTAVFVVEQNCPYQEADGKDLVSRHLYKEQDGKIACYARLLPPGVSFKEASIGRVMVHKEYRGRGLGHELMKEALRILSNEETAVKIQAQEYLNSFYTSYGFKNVSALYLEDGIPHIDMVKRMDEN
ncbi:GNAT family N-acetyltransferase [Bacillus mangrovi]|uniref:GNAT family N-acetyltransferase n=1 Tax=Metabacillus mangrovi TaxID=1491830 RepID=A0A7X2S6Y4_9BACI|nr:GNAT family N-acetyltransferase [Metabacillus mangrovi]MTH54356.1 GNAT family N-acetyltransferase [Metabacillus mangrovi]